MPSETEQNRRARQRTASVRATMDMTGLGLTKVYELMNEGVLRSTKIGRRRLIFIDSIDAMLEHGAQKTAA